MSQQKMTTRVFLYPEGTDAEITYGETDTVPGVGDRVQLIDSGGMKRERSPVYEVVRRDFTATNYGTTQEGDYITFEAALRVKVVEDA